MLSKAAFSLVFLLAVNCAMAQEQLKFEDLLKIQSKYRGHQESRVFVRFEGKEIPLEEYLATPRAIELEKASWLKKCDPQSRLAIEAHDRLNSANISLRIATRVPTVRIAAFGLKALPQIKDAEEKKWAAFVGEVENQLVDREWKIEQLVEELVELRQKMNSIWASIRPNSEKREIVVEATIKDHYSVIRRKTETWLLAELRLIEKGDGLFLTVLRDKFSNQRGRTYESIPQYVAPHPGLAEVQYELHKIPKRLPGREGSPKVSVEKDGLTIAERARRYSFELTDKRKLKSHQIEAISSSSLSSVSDSLADKAGTLICERIRMGTILTYDELHLICGDVAKEIQAEFPNVFCSFVLTNAVMGFEKDADVFTKIEIILGSN